MPPWGWLLLAALSGSAHAAAGSEDRPRELTIVALGDSTTAGTPYFLSPLEAPPAGLGNPAGQYSHWLMKARPGWRVLNRGINGERSDEIRARFERDVVAAKPRYVVILAGVNDAYQGLPEKTTRENLLWMYRRAKSAGIIPVAASIPPFSAASAAQARRIRSLNAWIARHARNEGLAFCDLHKAAADPGNPDRLKGSPDGLHPDVDGYRVMAEALAALIDELERKAAHER